MTLLVFGQTGQVASELQAQEDVLALRRDSADLTDPDACAQAIHSTRPRAVINAAAYTAVDRAEEEEALATVINGAAPAAMAKACRALGIPLVHISTDYVFAGTGTRAWTPQDAPMPQNAYGRSKLAGEDAIGQSGCTHVILRTSWVFSAHGNNFVRTMLRLGAERDNLRVVADQIGGPTPASAIAHACLRIADGLIADPSKSGTYHFCGTPATSWADFARAIMAAAGLKCRIEDIATAQYPTPARRPLNSRLDCGGLAVFGLEQPDWRDALPAIIRVIKEAQ
ncbi:dTDP-4-dehydrorhamnose reductase [Cereibacter johrii]|uniref:dTDP-4-dehydrorhamnose reductase n=1 Tax=Cereibacter johrii TaxID=445629 RepID=UPI002B263749|nr:dTDP-4-dehydrorhamnose reductase [Cereibacter johrii]MEA5163347.1 dTDP-4-dehydrorhamnose reductase [Cereibacter johrii]